MTHIDGRTLGTALQLEVDVVVVGSGPAGACAAREVARAGARVAVVEAGPWLRPEDFALSSFSAMTGYYRDMGASVLLGRAPMPFVQGRMVGGSAPINGGICWRLPRDVYDAWLDADPELAEALPWDLLEALTLELEREHHVAPTHAGIAGPKNLLMARGAQALGLEHRPTRRNVRACEGLGRCLQGCPKGRKLSPELTALQEALELGATVVSSAPVRGIELARGRARGVSGVTAGGGALTIRAQRAVILAASAVQTPALLLRNGLRQGPVGQNFQCHPGISMAGRFAEPVRMWEGATQGHEVIGLRHEGLKFEALGFGPSLLAARLPGVGRRFAARLEDLDHWLDWGVAVRSSARGRVRVVAGRPVVRYTPSGEDVRLFRRGLRVLGSMMFAAGAQQVAPGVRGFDELVDDPARLAQLEAAGPTNPGAYTSAVTHMFGSCRMGSDPARSVVRPDFRHHAVEGLYIADSSVFPSNTGVNPQLAIMTMATLCGRRVVENAGKENTNMAGKNLAEKAPQLAGASSARKGLERLRGLSRRQLAGVMQAGHGLDLDELADSMYLGVDLSLPRFAQKLVWETFCKTFHRDPESGLLRGWNVRLEQRGSDGPLLAQRTAAGQRRTFGHYLVRSARGQRFPAGWRGAHYLDYAQAGNKRWDLTRFAAAPLVAVRAGDMGLLLGWELLEVAGRRFPLPLYWALLRVGPLDHVVGVPRLGRGASLP